MGLTYGVYLCVLVGSSKNGGQVGDGGICKVLHRDEGELRIRCKTEHEAPRLALDTLDSSPPLKQNRVQSSALPASSCK